MKKRLYINSDLLITNIGSFPSAPPYWSSDMSDRDAFPQFVLFFDNVTYSSYSYFFNVAPGSHHGTGSQTGLNLKTGPAVNIIV